MVSLEEGNHQLLLNLHHIVCDGWSLQILAREIPALYDRRARGLPPDLEPLALQYADFAEEQRARLTEEELERHLGFWRKQLAGLPAQVSLPTIRPRPREQTFRGALQFFEIGEALSEQLASLESRYRATRFMVLLAAFKVLLYRYTGQADLVVGTPVANRNRREMEGLVGFFTNTLALRTQVRGEEDFPSLLARVRDATLDAYAHQDLPFEKLVQEMQPERSLAHNPLFQIMFALQSDTRATRRSADPRKRANRAPDAERFAPAVAKFDLALFLGEGERGLTGEVEYNTDLFGPEFIAGLVRHFRNLLAAIADSPETPVRSLPLLGELERQRVLLAGPELDGRPFCPVHAQIERRAGGRPAAIAAVRGDEQLTYGELNARANRLARRLQKRGLAPGDPVGICLGRDVGLLVATLAVWKAGAACVPLDPLYPAGRLAVLAGEAAVRLVVTDGETAERFPALPDRILRLERDREDIEAADETDLGLDVAPDSAAYIVFTSGSTGRPKGIAIAHRTLANLVQWDSDEAARVTERSVLHYAALGFDVSLQEIATTLAQGDRLVMISEEERLDFELLLDVVRRHGVSRLYLPPVALRHLAEAARTASPPKIDEIITAGEQLEISPRCGNFASAPRCRGSATNMTRGDPCRQPALSKGIRGAAGEAGDTAGRSASAPLYLDEWLEPVPPGTFGELFIAGRLWPWAC